MTNIKQDTTLTEVEIITALIDVAVTGVLEQRGYKGDEDFIVNIDTDETGIEVYIVNYRRWCKPLPKGDGND